MIKRYTSLMNYNPPVLFFSPHIETIFPAVLRKVNDVTYHRERINLADSDFLDLDWIHNRSKKLVIISHGLEGSSSRAYIKGMARAFSNQNYDVLAWNYRGCSEEMNRLARFYHSGATDDLDIVIQHALDQGYEEINLVGFSLGGNITLKYLGEEREVNPKIKKAVAFSVPMDLHASCHTISEPSNFIYSRRFLKNLKEKVRVKSELMPDKISAKGLNEIKTLMEFDDRYTAPIHGFDSAIHYYESCSSIRFVDQIKTKTLIVNALNDPFLPEECYPIQKLASHPYVKLLTPNKGGHVGFTSFNEDKMYWSEKIALDFIDS